MFPLLLGLSGTGIAVSGAVIALAAMKGLGAIEALSDTVGGMLEAFTKEICESLHLCTLAVAGMVSWYVLERVIDQCMVIMDWTGICQVASGLTTFAATIPFLIWIYIFCCSLWHSRGGEAESRKETKNLAPIYENFDGVRYKLGEGPILAWIPGM